MRSEEDLESALAVINGKRNELRTLSNRDDIPADIMTALALMTSSLISAKDALEWVLERDATSFEKTLELLRTGKFP